MLEWVCLMLSSLYINDLLLRTRLLVPNTILVTSVLYMYHNSVECWLSPSSSTFGCICIEWIRYPYLYITFIITTLHMLCSFALSLSLLDDRIGTPSFCRILYVLCSIVMDISYALMLLSYVHFSSESSLYLWWFYLSLSPWLDYLVFHRL